MSNTPNEMNLVCEPPRLNIVKRKSSISLKGGIRTPMTPTTLKNNLNRVFGSFRAPSSPISDNKKQRIRGSRFQKMSEYTLIRQLISEDKEVHDLFLQFSTSEFSSESVMFFLELITFQDCRDETIQDKFDIMYDLFLRRGSKFEVNISSEDRDLVEEYMKTKELSDLHNVTKTLEYSAFACVIEVFARFELSELYSKMYQTKHSGS
ncbi:hypothetical protein AKO1_005923 [Acrasis kona]|uniref:RGS domain-containing protein n=1 Tax=Acrasis kona TaxID=1008807 RepID=A0AAW2YJG2_9EUKA